MNELLGPEDLISDASDGKGDCECKDFYETNDLIRDGFSFYEFEGRRKALVKAGPASQ